MQKTNAYFGPYGGCFAPETLMFALQELEEAFLYFSKETAFQEELGQYLKNFAGRPTPLTFAKRLTQHCGGADIYFKREDLLHTGAHKINNALGQGLLAQRMGKKRLLAETGAGQHGVATATVAAALGMSCTVFMGAKDMERQAPNVVRMRLLGAEVCAVHAGSCTLKDATNEALRQWTREAREAYYLIGSALGPHPYPTLVREFQRIIGDETRRQIVEQYGGLPNELVACVGGGSNAIGFFSAFLEDKSVRMTGVEGGGLGIQPGQHAARFAGGQVGVLQGSKTYLLQDAHGQVMPTHSISAGLDYPAVGPEHAFLHDQERVHYTFASDEEALHAAYEVTRREGILPALESAHAIAYALKRAPCMEKGTCLVVNLSGRGDKDLDTLSQHL